MTVPTWVFDVDGCFIDSLSGTSLRPRTADLFGFIRNSGSRLLVWSAGGDTYAWRRLEQHGIDHLVHSCFSKEERDDAGCYIVDHVLDDDLHDRPTVFVDDRPEDLQQVLDVIAVSPYLADNPHDQGLKKVAERAGMAW